MKKTVKCKYIHCRHESKDIDKEKAVLVGKSSYYHKDCLMEKENIEEIMKLFQERINKNVVFSQLRRTINSIIYDKDISSEFLLFGLKYYISHKIPLNYPGGLYYVIQNKDVLKAYTARRNNFKSKSAISENNTVAETDFKFKPKKKKTFSDLLD